MTAKTPIIFRVQNDDGIGPYNAASWSGQSTMCEVHCDDSHLSPNRDSQLDGISHHEQCACDSPESLLAWFDGWWEQLDAAGFHVVIIRTADVRYGANGQCVYDRYAPAEERDTLDIDTFVGLFSDDPSATMSA